MSHHHHRKKKPSPPSSIPSSPLTGDFKDNGDAAPLEMFAELSLDEPNNLQTPPMPSPPISTTFLLPNQVSPNAPLAKILSSPLEPSPAKTTPYLEPIYKMKPIDKNMKCMSQFSSSPLAVTPTFPSPTITTPFYKPQGEVSGSPLLTPPSKKAAAVRKVSKRPAAGRSQPILPPPTPSSVPSSAVKIDQRMTALTNISPTLLSPEFPSPPISTPFLQSGKPESRLPKSILNNSILNATNMSINNASQSMVAASPTMAPPAPGSRPSYLQAASSYIPPPSATKPPPQPTLALVTPVQRRPAAIDTVPRLKSPPKSTPLDPGANIIKYEKHAAARNPGSPMLAVLKNNSTTTVSQQHKSVSNSSNTSTGIYSKFFDNGKENGVLPAAKISVPLAPVAAASTQPVQQLIVIHSLP